jgi:putative ABC transport system permease protein
MIGKTLLHQWKKMAMIAFTIALGASLATAMLSVMLDVGDKINQELKTYGANITVVPKAASVISDFYDLEDGESVGAYLDESELGNIKTIFWAFNIVDYAPFINASATLSDGSEIEVVGTWFNHHMALPTGEELDAGVTSLRTWWDITAGVFNEA